ncbi:hypothetical protein FAI41_01840 [Acetobacteraceae bacterium]|nr:hypothetical protein FAI41_01840 [Acetobacteraceae bacterium]
MKKIVLSLFAAATLVGCTTVEHIQTPEGHDLLDVTCSGFDHPANKCQRIANEECPGGYTLLSNTNASFGGWRNWFALGFNVQDSMVFQCHKRSTVVVNNSDATLLKKTIITTTKDKNGNIVSTTTNVETNDK